MLDTIVSNWPIKLLSLVLAYAIWFAVVDEGEVVRDFPVPLRMELAGTQILASDAPTSVMLRLTGPPNSFRRFDELDLSVVADLRELNAGPQEVQLTRRNVVGLDDRSFQLEFIEPDRVPVEVAAKRTRLRVPVHLDIQGEPPEGYEVYQTQMVPEALTLQGPAPIVDAVEAVRTAGIQLEGRRRDFDVTVAARLESDYVSVIGPNQIQVTIWVDEAPVERTIPDIPVRLEGIFARSWQVTPATVTLRISGPPRLLDALRPDDLVVNADVTALDPRLPEQELPILGSFPTANEDDRLKLKVLAYSRSSVRARQVDPGEEETP